MDQAEVQNRVFRVIKYPIPITIGVVILYELLVFLLPANNLVMDNYNLSPEQYHALLFILTLPLVLIWLGAFYAYGEFRNYTLSINRTKEANGFRNLTFGMLWLAWGLSVPAILALVLNSIGAEVSSFRSTSLIIINYLYVIYSLFAFSYMRNGSQALVKRIRAKAGLNSSRIVLLAFVSLGVFFCFFVFRKINIDNIASTDNPYHLSVWVLLITLIIPSLYAWFTGLLAAYELWLYSKNVAGVIYRQAMSLIAGGMIAVIAGTVGVQYIRSAIPRTGHITLGSTLVYINIVYISMLIGLILIILGIRKLKRFEEI